MDFETTFNDFADCVRILILKGEITSNMNKLFPDTLSKNDFVHGSFCTSFQGYIYDDGKTLYRGKLKVVPVLTSDMVKATDVYIRGIAQNLFDETGMDETGRVLITQKITTFIHTLNNIVAAGTSSSWATDWYPCINAQNQIIYDKSGNSPNERNLYLVNVGVDPNNPTETLEEARPGASPLGAYIVQQWQDIFSTALDSISARCGLLPNYQTYWNRDILNMGTEASNIESDAARLGLGLMLAHYDALGAQRGYMNLGLLYDTLVRLGIGGYSLGDDVQRLIGNANGMEVVGTPMYYQNYWYYEVKLTDATCAALKLSDSYSGYSVIVRVVANENHLLTQGAEVYVEANIVNGVPTNIAGPTLSMAQVRQHIVSGDLMTWLAGRQEENPNLMPHFTQYLFLCISKANYPGTLIT